MGADVADGETGGLQADDFIVHSVDLDLAFLDQLRLETAVTISGCQNRRFAVLTL